MLPYEDPDGHSTSLRSSRLKQWTVGMGRSERERVRGLESTALTSEKRPFRDQDEIAAERGVQLIPERGGMWCQVSLYSYNLIEYSYRTSWEPLTAPARFCFPSTDPSAHF